jgi:hypothetical protein
MVSSVSNTYITYIHGINQNIVEVEVTTTI